MESGNKDGPYWSLYCTVFVVCLASGCLYQWLYLDAWRRDTWMSTLSDVSGSSLCVALLVAIIVEASVVIFNRYFKYQWMQEAREQGLQQGLQQGREQGREEARKRRERVLARFGFEVDGERVFRWTPEIEAFLNGESDELPEAGEKD